MEIVKNYLYCDYETQVLDEEYYIFNEKKEGLYKKYYPNGNIRKLCYYINDEKNGECIKYSDNGNVVCIINYVNGIKHGKYVEYYFNGNLETEVNYCNGILQGEYKIYYDNQQLKEIGYYTDGVIQGIRQMYYKNGYISKILTFTSYPKSIEYKIYYASENGKICMIGNSTNGYLDDLIIYFLNGNPKINFKRIDKMCSVKEKYNDLGELIETINYTNGENFTIDYQIAFGN